MQEDPKIVILANGSFPSARQGLELLKQADLLICCDGAADQLVEFGLEPGLIIGDLDSLSSRVWEKYKASTIQVVDQESNDLTKAVRYCIKKGYAAVTILGATGLREDHTLGNISLMLEYFPHIKVRMLSDYGVFFLVQSGERIKSSAGEKISIFSVDNRVRVSSAGLKYPLENLELTNWYRASLNEASSDSFTLQFDSDLPLIIYKAW